MAKKKQKADSDSNNSDIIALRNLLLDTAALEELENMTESSPNIFSILKVESTEIRHSNFLAWLLSPSENHGLNQLVIERLLKWYAETYATDDDAVSLLLADGKDFRVHREWQGIDLLAVAHNQKIVLAIENKVFSGEHGGQLKRYYNAVMQHYPDYKRYFLYLTLEGDNPPYMEDIWHPIGYESIAAILEDAVRKAALSPEVILLINHYINTIRRLISMENPEIKELCNKIYQKHKTALDLIFRNVNMDERPELKALREWVTEWKAETDKRIFTRESPKWYEFSTPRMNKLLPPINGQIL